MVYLWREAFGSSLHEHSERPDAKETCRVLLFCRERKSMSETTRFTKIFNKDPKTESNLVQSAPLVIRVFINSSWPYRAATCSGVFPSLSTQSISPPVSETLVLLMYMQISHRLKVGFKQSKNSFTVLDERLGACKSSMNCRQMKRAFPITTLRKHQEMFSSIKHTGPVKVLS